MSTSHVLQHRSGNYHPKPDEPFPESIIVPFPVESKISGQLCGISHMYTYVHNSSVCQTVQNARTGYTSTTLRTFVLTALMVRQAHHQWVQFSTVEVSFMNSLLCWHLLLVFVRDDTFSLDVLHCALTKPAVTEQAEALSARRLSRVSRVMWPLYYCRIRTNKPTSVYKVSMPKQLGRYCPCVSTTVGFFAVALYASADHA